MNFGIIYGIGAYSLSQDIGVSVREAERLAKEEDGKDNAPLMPVSRVLVRREADGSETVVRKGVLSKLTSQ